MIQIALTLWIAALQLLLQIQNTPGIPTELRDQATYAANTAIVYAQGIIANPPVETKQVAEVPITETPSTPVAAAVDTPAPIPVIVTVGPVITLTNVSTTTGQTLKTYHLHFETNLPTTASWKVQVYNSIVVAQDFTLATTSFDADFINQWRVSTNYTIQISEVEKVYSGQIK